MWAIAAVSLAAFFALPKLHPLWLIVAGGAAGVALSL
jgi:hypothetical protein